jgi:uncharacterized glyoxalase superfamily protein PhnB
MSEKLNSPNINAAIPILPAADVAASLVWWTSVCGFTETFCDANPPSYAGLVRGTTSIHIARVSGADLARTVGEQTMVRFIVEDVAAMHAEYVRRGGVVHPNGPLQKKPWGTTEFAAIDPNGVCVTFQS